MLSFPFPSRAGPDFMPHHESGSLDSDCKRLRISSLVHMSAEEYMYFLHISASDFVDDLRSKGLGADM